MKTFLLNFEDGLDKQYVNWAREAVQDFINLFPEYKDNFAVKEDNISYESIDTLKFIANSNKELYQSQGNVFDEARFWRMFDRLPDGSYRASLQKQIALASRNGVIDIQNLSRSQADTVANLYGESSPILVNITKQKTNGNIRGISNEVSVNISAGTCADLGYKGADLKAYFKDIIIHELGHSFKATHERRQNVVENLGTHCTDKNCLMYEYAYTKKSFNRRKKLKEPFCSDCMESMRNFMQNELHFSRKNTNQSQQQNIQEVKLQDLPMFKNMTPAELKTLHNYQRILREKNIRRSKQDQLFDMLRITASTRNTHNSDPQTQGSVVIDDKKLEAYARTDWNDPTKFSALQDAIYLSKRSVRYPDPFTSEEVKRPSPEAKTVLDAQARQGKLAKVDGTNYDDYWIRKYSQGYLDAKAANPNQEQHRFILNVNPSEDLFKKLDDFADKYNCLYKSPQLISWGHRLDTVVLYTSDNRIAEQQKELIKIASPHIRKERNPNTLDGTKLADRIFTAKEFDKNDISALADRAQQNNLVPLADAIRKNLSKSTAHPLSLGEFLSYKEIIDNAEIAKTGNFNIVVPQKVNNTEQNDTITVSNEPLKEEHQGTDRTFKKALREVFEPSARKEGSVYTEDIKANNYVAKITHKDGSVDHISASSATNLSLSGQDKDGNSRVPDMQRFRDIAEYTHRKNTFVNFGDIKTPEFKAKLMLACMEHEPPVAMRGQPEVNKEFLDSLTDKAVKKMLEDALNKGKKKDPQQPTIINQSILRGGRD